MTMYTDKQRCRSSQQDRQRLSSVQRVSRLGIYNLASNRIKLMGPGRYRVRRLWNATLTVLGSVQQRDPEYPCNRRRQELFTRLTGVSDAYRHTLEDDARYRCSDGAMGVERRFPYCIPMSVSGKMRYHEPELYGSGKFDQLHLVL